MLTDVSEPKAIVGVKITKEQRAKLAKRREYLTEVDFELDRLIAKVVYWSNRLDNQRKLKKRVITRLAKEMANG